MNNKLIAVLVFVAAVALLGLLVFGIGDRTDPVQEPAAPLVETPASPLGDPGSEPKQEPGSAPRH